MYGNSYKRTYSTWGHAGVPYRYHVPHDNFPEGTWASWAKWPTRVPGWFNVDCQPTNRPAFERIATSPTGASSGDVEPPPIARLVAARHGSSRLLGCRGCREAVVRIRCER